MEKTNKGKYDLLANRVQKESEALVVDVELFFNLYETGWLFWRKKKYELTDFHRKFLRYLKNISQQYSIVYIAIISDYEYKRRLLDLLHITAVPIDFETEMNFQIWMKMTNPKMHFATLKRRNYYSNSLYITEDLLK